MKKIVLILFSSILLTGCSFIKSDDNIKFNLKDIYELENSRNNQIIVFAEPNITDNELNTLEENLKKIDNVEKIIFNSKEEIQNEMIASNDAIKEILGNLDENPLSDEFILYLYDSNKKQETIKIIKQFDNILEIK